MKTVGVKFKKKPLNWVATNYGSLGQFLKHLEKNMDTKTNEDSAYRSNYIFTGTHSFDEALELLRSGSAEIMAGLKKSVKLATEKLNKELNTQPEGYIPDVTGLFFDVARVIEGEPECWHREPWDKTKKPRLEIPVMGSYNAGFAKEKAIENATEIIALVKALESAGFECRLVMVFMATHTTYDNKGMFHSVMIKNFDENFNWQKLSAMLHPSFFRRLIFRDKELLAPTNLEGGYGRTAEPEKWLENGESVLKISDKGSVERFKNQILYRLRGNK